VRIPSIRLKSDTSERNQWRVLVPALGLRRPLDDGAATVVDVRETFRRLDAEIEHEPWTLGLV
jgi:hypothetical protein